MKELKRFIFMHLHVVLWLLAFCASIRVCYRVFCEGVCVLWWVRVAGKDVRLCWAYESVVRPPALGGPDSKHRASLPGQLSEDLFSSTPVCCGHTLRKYAAFTKHYHYCVLVSNCIKPSQICGSTWEFNYAQQPPSLPDLSVNLACRFYGQHLLAPLFFLLLLLFYVNFHLHEPMFVQTAVTILTGWSTPSCSLVCEIITLWNAGRLQLLHPLTTSTTRLPSVTSAVTATLF